MPLDPLGTIQRLVQPELLALMATMVHPGLFVGPGADCYKFAGSILHCARDPWFRHAVMRPGVTWNLSSNPTAIRETYNTMALNMVDATDPKYFSDEMVNAGLEFITERFAEGDSVLVHCNQGVSRSPSMCFLWLFEHGFLNDNFDRATNEFLQLYPKWSPQSGIWQYLKRRCENKA